MPRPLTRARSTVRFAPHSRITPGTRTTTARRWHGRSPFVVDVLSRRPKKAKGRPARMAGLPRFRAGLPSRLQVLPFLASGIHRDGFDRHSVAFKAAIDLYLMSQMVRYLVLGGVGDLVHFAVADEYRGSAALDAFLHARCIEFLSVFRATHGVRNDASHGVGHCRHTE